MRFHDGRRPEPEPAPPPAPLPWRRTLLACSLVAVVATAFAWSRIGFANLWGEGFGPRGIETREGMTCLLASLFTVALGLLDDRSATSREALLPGMLATTAVAAGMLLFRAWQGPGSIRGVTAVPTLAFHLALLAAVTAASLALWRHARGSFRPQRG